MPHLDIHGQSLHSWSIPASMCHICVYVVNLRFYMINLCIHVISLRLYDHVHLRTQYQTYPRELALEVHLINGPTSASNMLSQWLSFSPVANTAAAHFQTSASAINWLSTNFFFAFLAASPVTILTLQRGGPRAAILVAALLILVGNWLRYAGARQAALGPTMFGQILIGLAQPFVLSAPTQYSELWFSPQGRVSATAIMSLANPFGGALGQLINPFWADTSTQIPRMVLYVTLLATTICIPSCFVPSHPPTPVAPIEPRVPIFQGISLLYRNVNFWLLVLPFWVHVGLFNSLSSLLAQFLTPYGFTEMQAGIGGGILILVGLISGAIISPIVDRTKASLVFIRILVPVIAMSYVAFIWAPSSHKIAAPYVILGILGGAGFSLMPIALEFLAEITAPVGPEATSTICWAGGQLFGALFILISDALKGTETALPPYEMSRALVFQGILATLVTPCALLIGIVRLIDHVSY